jgi:hypothetical protein
MKRSLKSLACRVAYSPLGSKVASGLGITGLWARLNVRSKKKRLWAEAKKQFENGAALGTLEDYRDALRKHWVSYAEYAFQYAFYKKTETERAAYVSRLRMAYFYWRYVPGTVKAVFREKKRFLKTFQGNVHRTWLYAPETSYDAFMHLISQHDVIVKPCDGKLGRGIFKLFKAEVHPDERTLFAECVKNRMLVEQCIESCDELKAFHPQSLNSIRVVTVANRENACVFSGVFRTGVGDKVVDNSHAGGVSAQINVETGIVESDGADKNGNRYVAHPDSGLVFKGFQIPQWEKIVDTCCKAAMASGNPVTGWDVVLNQDGKVEFIEGNYGPDLDMMQTRYQTGIKARIYALIKQYQGIDLYQMEKKLCVL